MATEHQTQNETMADGGVVRHSMGQHPPTSIFLASFETDAAVERHVIYSTDCFMKHGETMHRESKKAREELSSQEQAALAYHKNRMLIGLSSKSAEHMRCFCA